MEGWVKIHRSIEEWEWEGDPLMYYFWVRLLVRVNHEDTEWRGMVVPRGSMITSLSSLAHDMHLSVRQVRTYTGRLTKRKQIVTQTTNKWTKITICKYEDYQGYAETKCQTKDTQNDTQNVNQRATNKEDKKKEEKKEGVYKYTPKKESAERLYAIYPSSTVRKEGGRASLKTAKDKDRLLTLLKSHTEEEIEKIIRRYVKETDPKYLKMFSTFLNNLPDYSEPERNDDRNSAENVLGPEYKAWIKSKKGQEFNELFK